MSDLPLTPEDVAEIVAILDGSGYATFELRTARFGLKVARSGEGWTQEWDHAAPGQSPFVEVGNMVGPETVIGIVETMKLMNPVHAGTTGRIAAIVAENGTMVDANAVLMRVEPA